MIQKEKKIEPKNKSGWRRAGATSVFFRRRRDGRQRFSLTNASKRSRRAHFPSGAARPSAPCHHRKRGRVVCWSVPRGGQTTEADHRPLFVSLRPFRRHLVPPSSRGNWIWVCFSREKNPPTVVKEREERRQARKMNG